MQLPFHPARAFVSQTPQGAIGLLDAESAWQATQPSSRALARALGLQFFFGAFAALVAIALPSPDQSDQGSLLVLVTVAVVIGSALRYLPRAGRQSVNVGIVAVIAMVTAAVSVARPTGLAPLFYLWPLMLTVNYASTPRLIATTLFTIAMFGAALVLGADVGDAPAAFAEFAIMASGVVVGMRRLRVRNSQLYSELRRQATRDGLTGALNRAAFEEAVEAAGAADGASQPAALLMLDIDHFKAVNDQHGHPAGDAAIRHLSDVVGRLLRPGDVFGRVGGEEFAVLLPATTEDDAVLHAERMRQAIAAPTTNAVPFTVSIGVAGDGDAGTWAAADRALYAAKRAGRNRVVAAGSPLRRHASAGVGTPPVASPRRGTHLKLLDRDQGGLVMPRRDG